MPDEWCGLAVLALPLQWSVAGYPLTPQPANPLRLPNRQDQPCRHGVVPFGSDDKNNKHRLLNCYAALLDGWTWRVANLLQCWDNQWGPDVIPKTHPLTIWFVASVLPGFH